jgi:rhodanese-related sulfurtransferase
VALKKILIPLVVLSFVIGLILNNKPSKPISYQDITVQEFDQILDSNDPFLVDVHTPEQTHIKDTDLFIPDTKVATSLDQFPQDKNTEILVYCRSGNMSQTASQVLVDAGYTNVKNLTGGLNAWREAHQEVTLTPDMQELGDVDYATGATLEYTLTNHTSQELNLTRVTGSCECTKPQPRDLKLPAYTSTIIDVDFVPSIHKDDSDLGELTRTIFIKTDNINFDRLESSFTANVIKQ